MARQEFEQRHEMTLRERNQLCYELVKIEERRKQIKEAIAHNEMLLMANQSAKLDWDAQIALDRAPSPDAKEEAEHADA